MRVTYWPQVVAGVFLTTGVASTAIAEVGAMKPASVIVFPKVVARDSGPTNWGGLVQDTFVQISNTGNMAVSAHCFFVNGAKSCPWGDECASDLDCDYEPCTAQWQLMDFYVDLTPRQPISWVVSQGRPEVYEPFYTPPIPQLGLLPFTGELLCVQVDADGLPIPGNSLTGEATLVDQRNGYDVAKYSAVGILGIDFVGIDGVLDLDGIEYDPCPSRWTVNHSVMGAAEVATSFAIVPCTQNFETQAPQTLNVNFRVTNEFEQMLSATKSVTCWDDLSFKDLAPGFFEWPSVGSFHLQTRMTSVDGGFLVIAQEFHGLWEWEWGMHTASAAANAHPDGSTYGDRITIPPLW
ncbi:MAG: hypothetical protein HY699_24275 [Deltaproteobacteria bacterium]|nr:hypothetical protein [Deltaproteobacteria bacterium]